MELKVFNGEKFERNKTRYIIFASIFILIFVLSAFYKNIVGIILMFFLLGAYIYYGIININETTITISENGLLVGTKVIPWNNLVGYCIELEIKKKTIKNIVLVHQRGHSIYTINDSEENIKVFLETLNQTLPILSDFPQTFREKIIRKIKL
ncbi:MAG TPA: hypothetical protein PLP73_03035 [Candidatus Absconditabacterales bacterium]|nr:hypothetical protein [Candidatus Absconditabacterales bacterium]HRU50078.1 hypothetical protein [Candidatus Absconditabacterales bacterium]